MNVNRNLNSQAKQLHSTENTGKKSTIGRSGVEKGNPTAKSKNVLKTFFGRVGKAITSRLATIKQSINQRAALKRSNEIDKGIEAEGRLKDEPLKLFKKVFLETVSLDDLNKKEFTPKKELNNKALTNLLGKEQVANFLKEVNKEYTEGSKNRSGKTLLMDDFMANNVQFLGSGLPDKLSTRWSSDSGKAKQLLLSFVRHELQQGGTINATTIFRGTSSCARLTTAFARTFEGGFTSKLLLPSIKDLSQFCQTEQNNVKLGSGQGHKGPAKIFEELIDRLSKSVSDVPQELCDASAVIYNAIIEAGGNPNAAISGSVVNMIALRLINPSLSGPKESVIDQAEINKLNIGDKGTPKPFILLSRAFQMLANGTTNVEKDENLKSFEGLFKDQGIISKWNGFMEGVLKRGGVVLEPEVNVQKQPENNPVQQGGGLNDPEVRRKELKSTIENLENVIQQMTGGLDPSSGELSSEDTMILSDLLNDLDQARGELNSLDQEPQEVQKQRDNNLVQQGGGLNVDVVKENAKEFIKENTNALREEILNNPNQRGEGVTSEDARILQETLDDLIRNEDQALQELINLSEKRN